ncbi:MAG TPA: DUF4388 domain-containing protein [Acidimicrobiales bacterium]|nr:DUF4388 domain-containing protein [Acidimicrobiales bacterium]
MLQGSFETLAFPEVLGMLASKRQSGRLRLHSGTSAVDLYLDGGRIAHAEATAHGSPSRVAESIAQLEEACFEVMSWDHGTFEFHPGQRPASSRGLGAEVEAVLEGARRRAKEWATVRARVPSLDVTPKLVSELAVEEVVVDRASWRVLAAVDGRRDVNALARVLALSPYELSRILSGLVGAGLVAVSGARPRVAMTPPTGSGSTSVRLSSRPEPSGSATSPAGATTPTTGPPVDPSTPEGPAAGPDVGAPEAGASGADAPTRSAGPGGDPGADTSTDGTAKVDQPAGLMRIVSRLRVSPSGGA